MGTFIGDWGLGKRGVSRVRCAVYTSAARQDDKPGEPECVPGVGGGEQSGTGGGADGGGSRYLTLAGRDVSGILTTSYCGTGWLFKYAIAVAIGVGLGAVVLVWLQAGQINQLLQINQGQSTAIQEMRVELKAHDIPLPPGP